MRRISELSAKTSCVIGSGALSLAGTLRPFSPEAGAIYGKHRIVSPVLAQHNLDNRNYVT